VSANSNDHAKPICQIIQLSDRIDRMKPEELPLEVRRLLTYKVIDNPSDISLRPNDK
jgi:hypothetical protein